MEDWAEIADGLMRGLGYNKYAVQVSRGFCDQNASL